MMKSMTRLLVLLVAVLAFAMGADAKPPALEKTAVIELCGESPCVIASAAIIGSIVPNTAVELKRFLADARRAGARAAVIGIASPGGDFAASEAMVEAIEKSQIEVHCYVRAVAASGAFWVLQACSRRIAEPDVVLMTHAPYVTLDQGLMMTKTGLREVADKLDMLQDIMAASIAARLRVPQQEVDSRLAAGDWYMTAEEAVGFSALDEVSHSDFETYIRSIRARYPVKKRK